MAGEIPVPVEVPAEVQIEEAAAKLVGEKQAEANTTLANWTITSNASPDDL